MVHSIGLTVLNVLYYVKLKNMMKRAFIKRISGMLKKDMSRLDYRRRANYCYVGEKPLSEMKYKDVCLFNCYVCGEDFEGTKDSVFKSGAWHKTCSMLLSSSKNQTKKLSLDEINDRAERCWLKDKNNNLEFAPGYNGFFKTTKYWYMCDICEHDFQVKYSDILHNQWCPYCINNSKRLCNDESCDKCWNKSLASELPNINFVYLESNLIDPRKVTRKSGKRMNWLCLECNHHLQLSAHMVVSKIGKTIGCKYCDNQALCEDENCQLCHEKSAACLSERTDIKVISHSAGELRMLAKNAHKSVTCECTTNPKHKWEAVLYNLNLAKSGCPMCKNKTENIVINKLVNIYGEENFIFQAKFDWCKNKYKLAYDILYEPYRLFIEIDGKQHTEVIPHFNQKITFEEIQERDRFKTQCALDHGYSLLRIDQERIYQEHKHGKKIWLEKLLTAIEHIKTLDKPISYGYAY